MTMQKLSKFRDFIDVYQHIAGLVKTHLEGEPISYATRFIENRGSVFTKQRWKIIGLIVLVLMVGMMVSQASAAPEHMEKNINLIEVTTTNDISDPVDGLCSLREAIISANTNPAGLRAAGECEHGSATVTDRIILQSGATYQMVKAYNVNPDFPDELLGNDYDIFDNPAALDLQIMPNGNAMATIRGTGPDFDTPVGYEGGREERIFEIEGATVEFYRLEIRNGVEIYRDGGGGVRNMGGNVTFVDSLLTDNRSSIGGALANFDGTMSLIRTVVTNNGNHFDVHFDDARVNGGGIYSRGELAQLYLEESVISWNRLDFEIADYEQGGQGGGIYNLWGTVTFLPGNENSEIIHNTSKLQGALHNAGGLIEGSNFSIFGNSALDSSFASGLTNSNSYNNGFDLPGQVNLSNGFIGFHSEGFNFVNDGAANLTDVSFGSNGKGSVFNDQGDVALTRVLIQHGADGGLISDGGTVAIDQSQIRDNEALTKKGGGIRLTNGAAATITRSSITHNTAQSAGGIYIFNSSLMMANSTISGNETAIGIGGGILLQSDGNGAEETVEFFNVTVHDNSSAAGVGSAFSLIGSTIVPETTNSIWSRPQGETTCSSSTGSNPLVSNGNNLAIDDSCLALQKRSDPINADPQLAPLAELEGTLMHQPLLESPVLNVADIEACNEAPVNNVDQRGYARGKQCDIGAVEFNVDN